MLEFLPKADKNFKTQYSQAKVDATGELAPAGPVGNLEAGLHS